MRGLLVLLFLIIVATSANAQKKISFDGVKEGKQLEMIQPISMDSMFTLWVHNRKKKLDVNWHMLWQDKKDTYFGRHIIGLSTKDIFFKVNTDSLNMLLPAYGDELLGERITQYIWTNVVPMAEKKMVDNAKCAPKNEQKFVFEYALADQKIIVTFRWKKINCKDLADLNDKKYTVTYDMRNKEYKTQNN